MAHSDPVASQPHDHDLTPTSVPPLSSAAVSITSLPSKGGIWTWALIGALLAGSISWFVGEQFVSHFKPKTIVMNTMMGPMEGATTEESTKSDSRNAALAYGIVGAVFGLAMGVAGGLARASVKSAILAGVAGALLGAPLSAGTAIALQPLYYKSLDADPTEQSLMLPLLVHAGIWMTAGAVAGLAFALGLSGRKDHILRGLIGGLIGAVVAAVAYEVVGTFLSSEAETIRPLSLTSETRMMARSMLTLLAAAGIAFTITSDSTRKKGTASSS